MKPAKRRKCVLCGKVKMTTNTDNPYVGRECLREGKDILLNYNDKMKWIREEAKKDCRSLVIAGIIIGFIAGMVLTAIYVKYIGG